MLRTSGRPIDISAPLVNEIMPDESRLYVVIPDIAPPHRALTPPRRRISLTD
jgi:Flp pilus assembly CpaF family ATPase